MNEDYEKIEQELGKAMERINEYEKKQDLSMIHPADQIKNIVYGSIMHVLSITRNKKITALKYEDGKFFINGEKGNKLEEEITN